MHFKEGLVYEEWGMIDDGVRFPFKCYRISLIGYVKILPLFSFNVRGHLGATQSCHEKVS
jgi:hypothetical protein